MGRSQVPCTAQPTSKGATAPLSPAGSQLFSMGPCLPRLAGLAGPGCSWSAWLALLSRAVASHVCRLLMPLIGLS